MKTVEEIFGREQVWSGNIFARVYASEPSHGKPLLVPYDLFRYMPWSDKILSRSQVEQFERLEIKRGCLFIVCSGRNLGPVTIADAFCEQFTMSHDMVRISAGLSEELFYLTAFLSTAHGQASIRTDMNGSVIDHTDEKQVAALRFPLVDRTLRKWTAERFEIGFEKREQGRLLLSRTLNEFLLHFGLLEVESGLSPLQQSRRFAIRRHQLTDRIDAEPNAPRYAALRDAISAAGGCTLDDIAHVSKPFGRYKTNYVDDRNFGIPMMNGRQIAQYRPIGLKLMGLGAFKDPESFHLAAGMTLLTADGRAEENLADCALVTDERAGWAASGHVYRITPRSGINPGLVYLACACAPSQAQLKAHATGSVVDALNAPDVASILVPYSDTTETEILGDDARKAWRLFSEAAAAEQEAVQALEDEFSSAEPL